MSGKTDKKQEEWLEVRKGEISKEISQIDEKIAKIDKRVSRQKIFLDERMEEIDVTKKKISELLDMETDSKEQITQHIEMLSWLIDSIDESIENLKNSMVENVDQSVKDNTQNFKSFLDDLNEIMIPLGSAKKIKDEDEMESIILSITSTLELFSENIDETIDIMSETIQDATKRAVEESGKEFDGFVEDIHQVFETFNTVLQKLKLTNSIKKYVELEKIYQECNTILDTYEEFALKKAMMDADKSYFKDELKIIDEYGIKDDKDSLVKKKKLLSIRVDSLTSDLTDLRVALEEYGEKLEFIEIEKQNLRSFFEALSDEIVESQKVTSETYNVMYATLDNIHSTIPFIKNELRNSSNSSIFEVINEFRTGIKTFGKIVNIIKKVQKVDDIKKQQEYITKINQKSKAQLQKLKKIFPKMSKDVRKANVQSIEQSFMEFNEFIETFKKKFYIIQDTVTAITLSTSERLISDLQGLFDDQIGYRSALIERKVYIKQLESLLDKYDRLLQSIETKLKIYEKKGDRTQRKVIKLEKTIL